MTKHTTWDDTLTLSAEHPRPTLQGRTWLGLDGEWTFKLDPHDEGLSNGWFQGLEEVSSILVPFPPESEASGVGNRTFDARVVWYQRTVATSDIKATAASDGTEGSRYLLHFGAVDTHATIWANGHRLGEHFGGNSPFSLDLTEALESGSVVLTVRASDHPLDVEKHRGKQDWLTDPHSIWYERTSGIWQSVWIEEVPALRIDTLSVVPNLPAGTLDIELALNEFPHETVYVTAGARYASEILGETSLRLETQSVKFSLPLSKQRNGQGYEELLWSPETPRLLDIQVGLHSEQETLDSVVTYTGLRSIGYANGKFLLNDRPYYMRSVLNQGYQTHSLLTAPSVQAQKEEIELIKSLGFNAARLHQKIEDPRLAYFADTLGLLLWVEMPSAYTTSLLAQNRLLAEWPAIIQRYRNHPSVMAWVPFNESWGIQHVAHEPATQRFVLGIWHLTKALDPSRLVVSNDGWELLETDIWSIHDYEASGEVVKARYETPQDVEDVLNSVGPGGRRMRIGSPELNGQPAMLTEFGGITFAPDSPIETWGYSVARDSADFEERLESLVVAVRQASFAGYCYTQLRDTLQEANGLVDQAGKPKLDPETYRRIFGGRL